MEVNSLPSEDKRPQRSQMAMNNDLTREQFKAREIEQGEPSKDEQVEENAEAMAAVQSQYRAMTVKGRKEQRQKLRNKMGLDGKPLAPRVRFVSLTKPQRGEELVEDKLYAVGKPPSDEAE